MGRERSSPRPQFWGERKPHLGQKETSPPAPLLQRGEPERNPPRLVPRHAPRNPPRLVPRHPSRSGRGFFPWRSASGKTLGSLQASRNVTLPCERSERRRGGRRRGFASRRERTSPGRPCEPEGEDFSSPVPPILGEPEAPRKFTPAASSALQHPAWEPSARLRGLNFHKELHDTD